MRNFFPFLILASFVLILSCNTDGGSKKVKTLSGYDYNVFIAGTGKKPAVGDYVYFQLDLLDDKNELLQSYRNQDVVPSLQILTEDNPARLSNPIVDVLSYCQVGDSLAIIVPKDSMPAMPPGYEELKYIQYIVVVQDVLTQVEHEEKIKADQAAQFAQMEAMRALLPEIESFTDQTLNAYKANRLGLMTTENGIKYIIHEKGTGDMPDNDRMVSVHYYGRLVSNGSSFDNSFNRGRAFTFRIGRGEVIRGWDEIVKYAPIGSKISAFIPSELAYGSNDSFDEIPPNSELYFYMELKEMYY